MGKKSKPGMVAADVESLICGVQDPAQRKTLLEILAAFRDLRAEYSCLDGDSRITDARRKAIWDAESAASSAYFKVTGK